MTTEQALTQARTVRTLANVAWTVAGNKLTASFTPAEAVSRARQEWDVARGHYNRADAEVKRLEAEIKKRALKEKQDDN